METALLIVGIASASIAGSGFGYLGISRYEEQRLSRLYRKQAGIPDATSATQATLQTTGIHQRVLLLAITYSQRQTVPSHKPARFWLMRSGKLQNAILKAGLSGQVNMEGCALVRQNLSLGLGVAGLLLGILFSEMMAFLLCVLGFIYGYHALDAALSQEVEARSASVEQELSQLVEILVLGLRSGLSFDRSLEFYYRCFPGGLSSLCERLQTQWSHGLITREEGLRSLSKSYNSPLLERVIESIIRSLRFGTSLAKTLSAAGTEIRATRKTKLEEKVAKAPVKMLIPIGTLILPAMLILILGPILLELISGF
jgi:tight adherence protein C